MSVNSLHHWAARHASRSSAALRTESVLRVLRGESTVAAEAVRTGVDVDTVSAWIDRSIKAVRVVVMAAQAHKQPAAA